MRLFKICLWDTTRRWESGERRFLGDSGNSDAIARALLGDPQIVVLDEATSSLDTELERRFLQNLERTAARRGAMPTAS